MKIVSDPVHRCMAFQLLLSISVGINASHDDNSQHDHRHNDHHRRSNLPLPDDRALAFHEGRNAVILERHQRLGFRPTETSLAQSGILSSQLLDLSLELGDFVLVIHGAKLRQIRTKLKQIEGWFAANGWPESRTGR